MDDLFKAYTHAECEGFLRMNWAVFGSFGTGFGSIARATLDEHRCIQRSIMSFDEGYAATIAGTLVGGGIGGVGGAWYAATYIDTGAVMIPVGVLLHASRHRDWHIIAGLSDFAKK